MERDDGDSDTAVTTIATESYAWAAEALQI
jgi:hypothetical protein